GQSETRRRLQERQERGEGRARRPRHEGQAGQSEPRSRELDPGGEALESLTRAAIIIPSAMIELHRVSKIYEVGPVKVPALTDVSFAVEKGEFVVINGPSGAGKTTLMRLLYREEEPTEGDVTVLGQPLAELTPREVSAFRRSIGVVFQDAKLLPGRTVYENIAFVLRVTGTPRREVTARAFEALRAVGLSARAQAYPTQLSQGEAQRAALARAIVRRQPLLIADEPTGNLDEEMAGEVLAIIKDIWARGTAVILATHQARLASGLRRRTLRLEAGRLVKDEGEVLGFLMGEAIRDLRRAGRVAVSAIVLITLSLVAAGAFWLLSTNLGRAVAEWRDRGRIIVYLKREPAEADVAILLGRVRELPEVASARYVNKADALAALKRVLGKDSAVVDLV